MSYMLYHKYYVKSVLIFQLPHQHHLDSQSDHVQIELYLKCSITHETKTKLDETRWKNIKTYKWTDTSKELLIEALSDESRWC
jgi:hypothetical protein